MANGTHLDISLGNEWQLVKDVLIPVSYIRRFVELGMMRVERDPIFITLSASIIIFHMYNIDN